ncbi:hypothetical protein [Kitasatospora sp. NPDC057015]|uniref:hypothetical protein n=1 Tax=Kitasatospora sp. NPDC057015 TaxID=3346001 RepID=UPI0036407EE2
MRSSLAVHPAPRWEDTPATGGCRSGRYVRPEPGEGALGLLADIRQPVAGAHHPLDLVRQAMQFGALQGHAHLPAASRSPRRSRIWLAVIAEMMRHWGLVRRSAVWGAFEEFDGSRDAAGGGEAAQPYFVEGELGEERRSLGGLQQASALLDGVVEYRCGAGCSGGAGEHDHGRRAVIRGAGEVAGASEAFQGGVVQAGLAQFVAVVAEGMGVQGLVVEAAGDGDALAGPACGGGEAFLGEDVAEANAGSGEQAQDVGVGDGAPSGLNAAASASHTSALVETLCS